MVAEETGSRPERPKAVVCKELLGALRELVGHNPIVVTNKHSFLNLCSDADMVTASLSGHINEYEIKISRSDFTRDKHKRRTKIYSGEIPGLRPNRFWYVTAPQIITVECLPVWAGWLEWENGKLVERRKAPKLHPSVHEIKVLMRLAAAMRRHERLRWRQTQIVI